MSSAGALPRAPGAPSALALAALFAFAAAAAAAAPDAPPPSAAAAPAAPAAPATATAFTEPPEAAAAGPEPAPAAAPEASEGAEGAGAARTVLADEGGEVQLACVLPQPVAECQWSWQAGDGPALVVKQFPPFGNASSDCGVRFTAALPDQQGLWTCGARARGQDGFATQPPVRLVVLRPLTFQAAGAAAAAVEAREGEPAALPCRPQQPAAECRWSWRPAPGTVPEAEPAPAQLQFAARASADCGLRLDSVRPEHAGLWTCEARGPDSALFSAAPPVHLDVLKGVTFVELSRDIQVNAGEPVALRCVVSLAVSWCQWLWRPLGEPDTAAVAVKGFAPGSEQPRDCSVRFPAVLAEQQGLWSCAVRAEGDAPFVEAPPATLTLLPAVKLRFLKTPNDTRVAVGHAVVLPCVATSTVTDCLWTWRSPHDPSAKGITVKQFSAFGNYSRDCSVNFTSVQSAQEGYWECSIRTGPSDALLQADSPLAKLTTFVSEPIEFTELSQDIHVPNGSHLFLRCVSSSVLKVCQWAWTAPNGTNSSSKVIKVFPAHGNGNHDCSMHITAAAEEHEGTWTCGARKEGESLMTTAPPARVTLLKPESVMVALWASPGEKVTLACRLSSPQPEATCYWQHVPNVIVSENNYTERHIVQQNNKTGICTLVMDPQTEDLGQWRCVFTLEMKNGDWELAAATLILLTTNSITNKTMDWVVGVLAGLVLLLTILIIVILVCKRKGKVSKTKEGLGNPTVQVDTEKKSPSRYTEAPSKINFQFGDTPLASDSPTNQQGNDPQHIYEPVDRYVSPSTHKSIYENVK